jgi:hypothetical protein
MRNVWRWLFQNPFTGPVVYRPEPRRISTEAQYVILMLKRGRRSTLAQPTYAEDDTQPYTPIQDVTKG